MGAFRSKISGRCARAQCWCSLKRRQKATIARRQKASAKFPRGQRPVHEILTTQLTATMVEPHSLAATRVHRRAPNVAEKTLVLARGLRARPAGERARKRARRRGWRASTRATKQLHTARIHSDARAKHRAEQSILARTRRPAERRLPNAHWGSSAARPCRRRRLRFPFEVQPAPPRETPAEQRVELQQFHPVS